MGPPAREGGCGEVSVGGSIRRVQLCWPRAGFFEQFDTVILVSRPPGIRDASGESVAHCVHAGLNVFIRSLTKRHHATKLGDFVWLAC